MSTRLIAVMYGLTLGIAIVNGAVLAIITLLTLPAAISLIWSYYS